MAARLGVPDEVIRKARTRLDEDDARLDQLLKQVEEDSRLLASERQALSLALAAAKVEQGEADAALRAAKEEARDVKLKARAEAKEVLAMLRQKLRELSRASSLEQAETKKVSADVEALGRKLEPGTAEVHPVVAEFARDLQAGDAVRIARLNKTGTVLTSHRGMLEVDGKKIKLSAAEVLPAQSTARQRPVVSAPGWSTEINEEEGASDRLNIIGLRVEEGLAEVDRFIDRAGLSNLSIVTVIHGLGTGALKAAVMDFLKNHPLIASIRPGEPAEGGAGITVAELKK
jgi:DNA mismatch repair protein MutS2